MNESQTSYNINGSKVPINNSKIFISLANHILIQSVKNENIFLRVWNSSKYLFVIHYLDKYFFGCLKQDVFILIIN